MPYKVWGHERLTASELQALLQDQVVAQFPHENARESAMPDPKAGQLTWLDTAGEWQGWDGERWVPLGPLRVTDYTALPTVGRPGMTAVDATGRHWEWRSIDGVYQWAWPVAAQGLLGLGQYIGTTPLAAVVGGAVLPAFAIPAVYVPRARNLRFEFSATLQTDVAGSYGFSIEAPSGRPQRQALCNIDAASINQPVHFTATKPWFTMAPGTLTTQVIGGRFSGAGSWQLIDNGATPGVEGGNGAHQLAVFDTGGH